MTLREKQSVFIFNVAKLINWAFENGFQLTIGEGQRTKEQQLLYFEGYSIEKTGSDLHFVKAPKKTKTLNSKHIDRLAIDLNVFIEGVYTSEKSKLQRLGDYWESLNELNSWGGNWKTFLDTPHFQMN